MKKIIDIHSHILPGVDDGCKSREEALAMLRMYEEQNVEAVVCTPHFGPCGISGADVEGAFSWISSQPSSIRLFLWNESLAGSFDADAIGQPGGPRLLSGTLLLEFDEWGSVHTDAGYILQCVDYFEHFCSSVIVAHPERYKSLQENPRFYKQITETGAALQINAYDIYDTETEATKITTRWLLENQLVSFIGSDAHGAVRRSPSVKNGVQWVYDHCPGEYADAIVHDNAVKLLQGEWRD